MIDYGIIDSSIKYYEKLGYQRVESPWTVSESIDAITRPKEYKIIKYYFFMNKFNGLTPQPSIPFAKAFGIAFFIIL